MGKNGDPQAGWMKEGVLEQRGCSCQVDKFQQLSGVNLYCVRCGRASPPCFSSMQQCVLVC